MTPDDEDIGCGCLAVSAIVLLCFVASVVALTVALWKWVVSL